MPGFATLKEALEKPYELAYVVKNVLSPVFNDTLEVYAQGVDESGKLTESERQLVARVVRYGELSLDNGNDLSLYEITLQSRVRLEQSRVGIQQYVRKLLMAGQGALLTFTQPGQAAWRLSLVASEARLTSKGIEAVRTHAKRYTYLLGPGESARTAAERLVELSANPRPDLDALVRAFSVEKLSKAFFDEYTLHYQKFCNYLQESNFINPVFKITIPANATKEEKDKACKPIRDFVKKLLGRIVFLYFVQKKGWLGASDTNYKDGLNNFIKRLFTQSGGDDTFYPNWLTKLFFETLNKERSNDDFKMPDGKKVKVPFLNGGLFDKEDYDEAILPIPAKLFHHPDFDYAILTEKSWSNARGFLDFLDAFNFTVHEDSPDDHTVAVDPEMLGHIFENLLEDNKDKGAFYTPKEIVHYMCQESLTEYLTTHLSKEYTVYKEFGNAQVELFGNETKSGQLKMVLQLGDKALNRDDVAFIVKHKDISHLTKAQLKKIDALLDTVKICDPAIGSGAFPMGLLQEIHAIKEVIAYELQQPWKPADVKENIIQNSVYGVDIEKGAVDIARLRFWLSLVVDEEKPRALPNLDYKIVMGDSLMSKFEGEIIEIDWEIKEGTQANLFGNENVLIRQALLKEITSKQQEYFHAKNKQKLAAEIRTLKIDILINQLELMIKTKGLDKKPTEEGKKATAQAELWLQTQSWKNTINKLNKLKQNSNTQFEHFDWKLDFPEMLNPYLTNGNAGFDIVIANPPYISVRTKNFDNSLKDTFKQKFKLAVGQYDLYTLFLELTNDILSSTGIMSFIIPQRMLSNENFEEARKFVMANIPIFHYVNAKMPFENANVEANIMIGKKGASINSIQSFAYNRITKKFDYLTDIYYSEIEKMPFKIYPFIYTKDRLSVFNEIQNQDFYRLGDFLEITRGFECGYKDESIVTSVTNYPLIRSEAISKYVVNPNVKLYCLPDFSKPSKYKTKEIFQKVPKLVTKFVASEITFAIDNVGYFNTNSVYNCHLKENVHVEYTFLLAVLNSKLITFWFNTAFLNSDGLFPHIQKNQLESIPLKFPTDQSSFINIVHYVVFLNTCERKDYFNNLIPAYFEQIIDGMVYELYFPELIKKHKREIIQHLGELPEFTNKLSDEEKMKICTMVFNRLNSREHPVRVNLFFISSIPEIAIIEGKNENN